MKKILALLKYMVIPFMLNSANITTPPNVEIVSKKGFIISENAKVEYVLECDSTKCYYDIYLKPGFYAFCTPNGKEFCSFYVNDSIATQIGYVLPEFDAKLIK